MQRSPFGAVAVCSKIAFGDKHRTPLRRIQAQWDLFMKKDSKLAVLSEHLFEDGRIFLPNLFGREDLHEFPGASIFGRIHWSERGSSRTVTIRHAVLSPPVNSATAMPAGIAAALRCILLRYDAAEYPDRRDADRSRQMLLGRETFGHAERLPGDRESLNPVQSIDLYSPVLLGRAIYIPPPF